MVVFTCNNCGETLQKPRVAKHYQFQCRSAAFLTCVDCFKDFRGDEYVGHTKCITEAERYGGKDYVPKASTNKGERKQQAWLNIVNNMLESSTNLTNAERGFLNSLAKYQNIPRKKAKFFNFVCSALGNRINMTLVEGVWNKMEAAHKDSTQSTTDNQQQENGTTKALENLENGTASELNSEQQEENNLSENQNNENICRENQEEGEHNNGNESHNGNNDSEEITKVKHKKSKKRDISKAEDEPIEAPVSKKKSKNNSLLLESSINQTEDTFETTAFDWKSSILNIVQSKGELSLKKLQKKVIAEYMNHNSDIVVFEKASAKFNKKLMKLPEIIVAEKRVKLA